MSTVTRGRFGWTVAAPVVAMSVLTLVWGRSLSTAVAVLVAVPLFAAVLAAVHHAEVVAHRVGEPFGSLVLAVAVTVIEVGADRDLDGLRRRRRRDARPGHRLRRGDDHASTGSSGCRSSSGPLRHHLAHFNAEGTGSALATVITLAGVTPGAAAVHHDDAGPEFTGVQLAFAAVASLALYGLFVFTQTVRHRDFFLPVGDGDRRVTATATPTRRPPERLFSLGLLLVRWSLWSGWRRSSPRRSRAASPRPGFPRAFVGVVIALLVLLPESIAAVRAAHRDEVQTSLNLAYGSAMASHRPHDPHHRRRLDLARRSARARARADADRAARPSPWSSAS